MLRKSFLFASIIGLAMGLTSWGTHSAQGAVTVNVDASAAFAGFMNVSLLDRSGPLPAPGTFEFGSGWGVADTTAVLDVPSNTITLVPNTIGDPDPYWYIGGGGPGQLGNKWMDANTFIQETDTLSGMDVTFQGKVLSNTLLPNHTASVFIRDFAPDFSSFNEVSAPLTPGDFSITLATDPGAGRHVQYGFNMQGENVWTTDVGAFGNVVVTAVPEPSSVALLAIGTFTMIGRRRRR